MRVKEGRRKGCTLGRRWEEKKGVLEGKRQGRGGRRWGLIWCGGGGAGEGEERGSMK